MSTILKCFSHVSTAVLCRPRIIDIEIASINKPKAIMSSVPTVPVQFYIPDQSSATASSGSSADDLQWVDATSQASSSCGQSQPHRDGTASADAQGSPSDVAAANSESSDPTAATAIFPMRTYGKWCPTTQGATLVWRDVCVYATRVSSAETSSTMPKVPSSGGGSGTTSKPGATGGSGSGSQQLKRLINNATGAIRPGTLMALMGSSGAGKSTLMSALAYRNHNNTIVHGDILLNGRPIGPFMHRLSGFVHQDDLFIGTLTVREHLTFMAHFRLDRRTTSAQRQRLIGDLLHRTGLAKCAASRIGCTDSAASGKVLSGGERKRLAFATELLTRPTILFCDEPTTGLDSYGAQQLVRTLQLLARRGTTIMCTIHQPSSQLFAMFQQVLLMADGRVAFMGEPAQAMRFFAEHGHVCPAAYNPAEFLIGVLATAPGCERASQRTAQRLCDLFAVSEAAQQRDVVVNLEMHMAESGELDVRKIDTDASLDGDHFRRPFWWSTLFWLTYRLMLATAREPAVLALRMGQKIAIAVMAGLCFNGSIDLTQYGVQALQGALFLIVSENTFSPMYAVLAVFPQAFPLFMREKSSGNYGTVQYYVAHVVAMLPCFIIEPLLFCVTGYWLAGLRPTAYAFGMTTLVSVLVINVAAACGTFFSTAFNSVPLAMAYLVPFDYILMITSGVFVRLSSITPWLAWLQYLSWFMYANEAMSIVQWQDVQNITCYTEALPDEQLPCLHSGVEVLEQYSFSGENLQRDLWSLVVLYVVFNVLALFCLWRRARSSN